MELDELLIAAAEAPPDTRIEYRDRIAAFGDPAVEALMTASWIGDPNYAGFAIQVIRKTGEHGTPKAVAALRRASALVSSEWHRRDIDSALVSLGARPGQQLKRGREPKSRDERTAAPIAPEDLVVGRCYRRSEIHDGGLGGNRQKGISYSAKGTHCLLFSDPSKDTVHGYRDQPVGDDRYRYFGEWSGTGDMVMTGGNKAVVDRSSELYLFTAASCGHIFRGRFNLVESTSEKATRDGKQFNAIVFELRLLS